jgi:hypothetical protein
MTHQFFVSSDRKVLAFGQLQEGQCLAIGHQLISIEQVVKPSNGIVLIPTGGVTKFDLVEVGVR